MRNVLLSLGLAAFAISLFACERSHGGEHDKRDKRDNEDRFPPIARTATITTRTGTSPIPTTETTCLLEVSSLPKEGLCRAWLTCGGARVYGSNTSHTYCTSSAAGPTALADTKPTPVDRDARLEGDLVAGDLTLSDTSATGDSYSVRMRLAP